MIAAVAGVALALAAPPHPASNAHATAAAPGMRVTQRGDRTVVAVTRPAPRRTAVLPADEGIYPHSLGATRIVGAVPGGFVIFVSDHASRPNGGAHQCGAGTETVLRVIALRPTLHQTFALRLESCWQTIEAGEVGWDAAARRLTVERTTFTPDERHLRTIYAVADNGRVTAVESMPLP